MGGISIEKFLQMKAEPNNPRLNELVRENEGNASTLHFEAVLGPTYYSLDWGGRHFAFWPNEHSYYSPAGLERKERWLWADLALQPEEREIVVVVHTPPPGAFLQALSRYNVRLVLHGHWHSSRVSRVRRYRGSGSPAGLFRGNRHLASGLPPGAVPGGGRCPGRRCAEGRARLAGIPRGIPAGDRIRRRAVASPMGAPASRRAAPGGSRVVRRTRVPDAA